MLRNVDFICGFNGFNQFTDLVQKRSWLGIKTNATLSPPNADSNPGIEDCGDRALFFVNPVELQRQDYLVFSWSSVFAVATNQGDYKRYGFANDDSSNSFDEGNVVFFEDENPEQRWLKFEYPDCPRGVGFHSTAQIRWNLNINSFYLICDEGVFEARDLHAREREGSKRHIYTLSRFTIPDKTAVKSLSCGKEHVLLLTVDGNVLSFGSGSRGQLGLGSLESRDSPTVLEVLQPLHITMISAGGWHSVALSNTGDVYSWGWNQSGQLGIGCYPTDDPLSEQKPCSDNACCNRLMLSAYPILVDFRKEVQKVSCGARHSAAVLVDNTLWTWGWNGYGQLGLGHQNDQHCPNIVKTLSINSYAVIDVVCNMWNTLISTSVKNS